MLVKYKLNIKHSPLLEIDLLGNKLNIESVIKYFIFLVGLNWSDEDRFKLVLLQPDKIFVFIPKKSNIV